MPASLNASREDKLLQMGRGWTSGDVAQRGCEPFARCLTIGLINNMPDGAMEATERQFLSLLDAASGSMRVRLVLFSFSGIRRTAEAAARVRTIYSGIDGLRSARLDGLIVTGREPMAASLPEETYWKELTQVVEWARKYTYSSIWSCLAAHAAVLYSDGVPRVRSKTKICGTFECATTKEHPLTLGVGAQVRLPHSRWHGLSEWALKRHGYSVLTRSEEAGVDSFAKLDKSLFVYFQGHPEYESNSLLLEYRRDVARFLRGESGHYPEPPRNYFDDETQRRVKALQEEAIRRPRRELLAEVYAILLRANTEDRWRPAATRIYRNWLEYVCAKKQEWIESKKALERDSMRSRPGLIARMGPRNATHDLPGKAAVG